MNFFDWQSRKQKAGRAHPRPAPPDREEPAAPSEPMRVEEGHASTTVIERLFQVMGKRRG
jgi:hypothetical protein